MFRNPRDVSSIQTLQQSFGVERGGNGRIRNLTHQWLYSQTRLAPHLLQVAPFASPSSHIWLRKAREARRSRNSETASSLSTSPALDDVFPVVCVVRSRRISWSASLAPIPPLRKGGERKRLFYSASSALETQFLSASPALVPLPRKGGGEKAKLLFCVVCI